MPQSEGHRIAKREGKHQNLRQELLKVLLSFFLTKYVESNDLDLVIFKFTNY